MNTASSSMAVMGRDSWPEVLRKSRWDEGGTPVTGSNFALSVLMDHAGVMRRSEDELSDTTSSGMSAMTKAVTAGPRLVRLARDCDRVWLHVRRLPAPNRAGGRSLRAEGRRRESCRWARSGAAQRRDVGRVRLLQWK